MLNENVIALTGPPCFVLKVILLIVCSYLITFDNYIDYNNPRYSTC